MADGDGADERPDPKVSKLRRQEPGKMGLGTSDQRMKPPRLDAAEASRPHDHQHQAPPRRAHLIPRTYPPLARWPYTVVEANGGRQPSRSGVKRTRPAPLALDIAGAGVRGFGY